MEMKNDLKKGGAKIGCRRNNGGCVKRIGGGSKFIKVGRDLGLIMQV